MNEKFPLEKDNLWMSEAKIVDLLCDWKDLRGKFDLKHLTDFLTPAVDLDNFLNIKGIYIAKNTLREKLGFAKGNKPGDFDLLIIPYDEESILFETTICIEIKIVRPTRKKPDKNADSLGITQVKGLIIDGFPIVGLMHISMTEPLLEDEKLDIDYHTQPLDVDNLLNNTGFVESKIKVKHDHFSWFSADKQMKRLISQDIPKYVGIGCLGLDYSKNGRYSLNSCSRELSGFQNGYFNPHKLDSTVEKVKTHFLKHRETYLTRNLRD